MQERPKRRVKPERRKAVRRARIILALSVLIIVTLIFMVVMLLRGYFETRSETTLLTVEGDGAIVFEEVTEVSSQYDPGAISDYAQEQVDAFTPSEGGSISLERTAVDDNNVYVRVRYSDYSVYQDFTGYTAFYGTISQAKAAGYDFAGTFLASETGFDPDKAVPSKEVAKNSDHKVFVIEENVEVAVDGEILYVSLEGTKVSDNKVSINPVDGNMDAPPLCYIIFK